MGFSWEKKMCDLQDRCDSCRRANRNALIGISLSILCPIFIVMAGVARLKSTDELVVKSLTVIDGEGNAIGYFGNKDNNECIFRIGSDIENSILATAKDNVAILAITHNDNRHVLGAMSDDAVYTLTSRSGTRIEQAVSAKESELTLYRNGDSKLKIRDNESSTAIGILDDENEYSTFARYGGMGLLRLRGLDEEDVYIYPRLDEKPLTNEELELRLRKLMVEHK